MPEFKPDNRRIAKNTLLLYVRMFLIMAVQLYISREILAILGIEDYGIYSVVGGIVSMFSFLNYAMTNTTLRFLTYELGKNNFEKLKQIFVTALNSHFLISIIILLLAETVGLWFLNEKIVIPQTRQTAAFWVYQSAIAIMILSIINAPYNAAIIAHEKMSAYAYLSIFDVLLKLSAVFILKAIPCDKLIAYALSIFFIQAICNLFYFAYCRRHFQETKFFFYKNLKLFKELTSFASLSLCIDFANIFYIQSFNILLNIFFGPALNAARGIENQVRYALQQFSANFQTALNPQIIKSYAANQLDEMYTLIFRSSRFSFLLIYIFALPIFIFTPTILNLWLKEVPDFTVIFIRITIIFILIKSTSNSLAIATNATGKIKRYQTTISGILLTIIPISYIVLKLGGAPWTIYIVDLSISIVMYLAQLFLTKNLINLSIRKFIKNVIFRAIIVVLTSIILPIIGCILLEETLLNSILLIILTIFSAATTSFFFGLEPNERKVILQKISSLKNRYLLKNQTK